MSLKEIKQELKRVAERLHERKKEIVEQPDLVMEDFRASVEIGMLTDIELFRLEDYIGRLDDEYSNYEYVVEMKYGSYRGECDWPIKAFFTTEVVSDELTDSFEYVDGYLEFKVNFNLVVFEHTEWDDCFVISDDVYDERMETFEEMTEEEWEDFDC